MNFYLENNNKKDCFNCSACAQACPVKAIKMKYNNKDGYYYPAIDKNKCINCGKCKKVCINLNRDSLVQSIKAAYVIYNKDMNVRLKSASGGISSILMDYVCENNGVVYGACYDQNLKVVHERATTKEECEKFKTSKYVKSYIGNVYSEVLNDLREDKLVLFTGTPCQVAGLKSLIPKKLQLKLILCEIMCDCVASPLFFEKFKQYVEKIYNNKISKINFRSKVNGAHSISMVISFENGLEQTFKMKENNLFSDYMQVYGCGLASPYCCLNCEFEHIDERTSDFTIGDYWGKKEILKDDNCGISLLLINSKKAESIFKEYIEDKVVSQEVSPLEALNNNHQNHKQTVLNKEKFMEDLSECDYETLIKRYVTKYKWRTKMSKYIPPNLKEKIKKTLKRWGLLK